MKLTGIHLVEYFIVDTVENDIEQQYRRNTKSNSWWERKINYSHSIDWEPEFDKRKELEKIFQTNYKK
jgi:hypothetical protein